MHVVTLDGDKAALLRQALGRSNVQYTEKFAALGGKITFSIRCSAHQASELQAWVSGSLRPSKPTTDTSHATTLRGGYSGGMLTEDQEVEPKGKLSRWSYNNSVLREWVSATRRSGRPRRDSSRESVGYIGNGPLDPNVLHDMLIGRKFISGPLLAANPTPSISVVILGRNGWTREEVDALIDERIGQTLKIYSQEMYLAYLETGKDPFTARREDLEAFKGGHPGLEFVADGWQGWVTTEVVVNWWTASSESMDNKAWPERSPLCALGYKVGERGQPTTVRWKILRKAFEESLPKVGPSSYMAEWGEPESGERLKKMAEDLASFCKLQKRKQKPSQQAIADWEEDLEWLRITFYHGHFRFCWPKTSA